jgi:hypothetical protein
MKEFYVIGRGKEKKKAVGSQLSTFSFQPEIWSVFPIESKSRVRRDAPLLFSDVNYSAKEKMVRHDAPYKNSKLPLFLKSISRDFAVEIFFECFRDGGGDE